MHLAANVDIIDSLHNRKARTRPEGNTKFACQFRGHLLLDVVAIMQSIWIEMLL